MGKRKSSKKPVVKKVKPKLDTTFNCPFCNAAGAVHATLDFDAERGKVSCGVCGEEYVSVIDRLAEPVDVYAAWIDACEEANNEKNLQQQQREEEEQREEREEREERPRQRPRRQEEEEEDDDDEESR